MFSKNNKTPELCPGTNSLEAGKSEVCKGCPNQKICSSDKGKSLEEKIVITKHLSSIKKRILILSGKGGVGKSTFTSRLAISLGRNPEIVIGLLDADICGPSIPTILGTHKSFHLSGDGSICPAICGSNNNILVASIGLCVEEDDAMIWRGPKKTGLLFKLLSDIDWSDTSIILVDTPPGISDEHFALLNFLNPIDGAILITGPQELSWQDVRKEVNFCIKNNIPIIALVSNLNNFVCSNCNRETYLFPNHEDKIKEKAIQNNWNFFSLPIDTQVTRFSDEGDIQSLISESFENVINEIACLIMR